MAASQRILLGHVKGDKGDTGATPTINVGTVTPSAPGTNPQVTMTGPPEARSINFTLPRGETGPGGGITPVRSHHMPLIFRLPFNCPAAPNLVLGAMDTLGWDQAPEHPYTTGFVYYFTNHPTQGIMRGWNRTASDARVSLTEVPPTTTLTRPMFTFRACPVNFGTLGYRGNWSREVLFYGTDPGTPGASSVWQVRGWEFDGLAFTNSRTALWVRGRAPRRQWWYQPQAPELEVQSIVLDSLPNATMTAMWAGKTSTQNFIWVIMNNRLYRLHIVNSETGSYPDGEVVRHTITGAADLVFDDVTDSPPGTRNPDLPTTMNRVYAEGQYAAVWGTNPANRLAYWDGTQWYRLTVPFSFNASYLMNNVIIYTNGFLGVYDPTQGRYYTCTNPTSGGNFTLRYTTGAYRLLTNGFMRGIPQFVPRSTHSNIVHVEFNTSADDDGTTCFVNPSGESIWSDMLWPSELYCSTGRPDVVPSNNANHGYAYPWGTTETYGSIMGDTNTALLTATFSPNHYDHVLPLPPQLKPARPRQLFGNRSYGPTVVRDEVRHQVTAIYVSYP